MHLIVFCDGTWNTPDDKEGDLPAPTNVVKLRNALAPADKDGLEQKVYYHPGVGTGGGWWDRIAGGGLGDGLDHNVMSGYYWLARNYQPGDLIWLFGFSRGAYTVRSLGGMITRGGLLDASDRTLAESDIWADVQAIFTAYRAQETLPQTATRRFFGNSAAKGFPKSSTPIHCIGVWDTVGALGVPDDMALLNLIDDPAKHSFHDTALNPNVLNARHAIAIDERRQGFTPTLWTNVEDRKDTVKQIWFPGVHADVGGGYALCGLSDGALYWMIQEAEGLGLAFRDSVLQQLAPDPRGLLHDSVQGVFKALKTRPREVPLIDRTVSGTDILHESALSRHDNPPLTQGDYWKETPLTADRSATVDIFARQPWNYTGIYLREGQRYGFSATGEWMDSSDTCGPGGTKDGTFELGEAAHIASTLWGKGEALYTRLTGNAQIDFWWTKRQEQMPWFALVGVIASGFVPEPDPDDKLDVAPHEIFLIGKGATLTPKASGYLYAFANDAWQAYGNNKGSVQLTVKQK